MRERSPPLLSHCLLASVLTFFLCVQLETIENFTAKIKAGQAAKISPDFMIAARMESLIAGHGQAEALKRAVACTEAGADAIMIHSKEKSPAEVGSRR